MSNEEPSTYVDPATGEVVDPSTQPGAVEVLPPAGTDLVASGGFVELEKMLRDAQDRSTQDPDEIQRNILEKILTASTAEEVFAIQDIRHAREMLGVPIEVTDIRFNVSDYAEGVPFYMIVDAYDVDGGGKVTVSCGGASVMAQLYQLKRLGAFPAKLKFQQTSRPTKAGFYPMYVEPAT